MKTIISPGLLIILMCTVSLDAQSIKVVDTEKLIENSEKVFMAPVWSPDGSMIAFTGSGYKGIWTINLIDKKIKQITDEEAAGFGFKWSDDSRYILTRVAKYEGVRRYNAIKVFNAETGEMNVLTDYRTIMTGLPQFVAASEKVFIYGKGKTELFNSGIDVKQIKKLNPSEKIVYIRDDKIAVEDVNTNKVGIIEPVKGERILNLQLSPDGEKTAFEIIGGDMYVMNIDGSNLKNLGRGYRPKWSPDSKYLTYMISEDDGYRVLASDIFTIKIDGSEKTNLTNTNDRLEMNPSWSPDGDKIAYDILDEGAICIMRISR